MRVAVATALVGAVLLGGCNDDSSSESAQDEADETSDEQRVADEAVLAASDLPAGWTASQDADIDNTENGIDECSA